MDEEELGILELLAGHARPAPRGLVGDGRGGQALPLPEGPAPSTTNPAMRVAPQVFPVASQGEQNRVGESRARARLAEESPVTSGPTPEALDQDILRRIATSRRFGQSTDLSPEMARAILASPDRFPGMDSGPMRGASQLDAPVALPPRVENALMALIRARTDPAPRARPAPAGPQMASPARAPAQARPAAPAREPGQYVAPNPAPPRRPPGSALSDFVASSPRILATLEADAASQGGIPGALGRYLYTVARGDVL